MPTMSQRKCISSILKIDIWSGYNGTSTSSTHWCLHNIFNISLASIPRVPCGLFFVYQLFYVVTITCRYYCFSFVEKNM